MPAYGYEFYLLVVNSISHSFASLTREMSSWPLEDKIHIHARACNILYISSIRKIAVTWILARVFAYIPSLYFQILDVIYWAVLIFYFGLFWMAWHWKPAIHMKKILDSDWLRAVQFKCNTSAKSVTPVKITHRNSGFWFAERQG